MNSLQTIFDTVVTHLRNQGCKALNSENFCRYKIKDSSGKTLMCAAGCLIPESDYQESFEGQTIGFGDNDDISSYFSSRYSEEEVSLISDLQGIHDKSNTNAWESLFQGLAEERGLRYNPA